MNYKIFRRLFVIAAFLFATTALVAEQAELKVEVKPKEAFLFVDGKPYGHHAERLELAPGEHTLGFYNYGFVPQVKTVTLKEGDNPKVKVKLEPAGDAVQPPFGRLKIEGVHNRDAVFLNGKTPEFFIGHVDEATSHMFLSQKLILPPGIHQVTIVDPRANKEVFSGPVEIIANRETILDAKDGKVRFEPWHDGSQMSQAPRFQSTASETIVTVAPVNATLAAQPAEIICAQPVRLVWNTADAVHTTITANGVPIGTLPVNGEQTVSPRQTTTYELTSVGPGGVITTKQTVRVDPTIQTSLAIFPAEIRYRQVDDLVKEQGTATLKWTASNADSVRIDPIGPGTGTAGEESLTALPTRTDFGPVDEMKTYRITATNVCGGSDTSTASLHITGSIDHEIAETMPVEDLPETASPLPLIGLLGLGTLVSGIVARKFRK